jgi:hypothetical protein
MEIINDGITFTVKIPLIKNDGTKFLPLIQKEMTLAHEYL